MADGALEANLERYIATEMGVAAISDVATWAGKAMPAALQ